MDPCDYVDGLIEVEAREREEDRAATEALLMGQDAAIERLTKERDRYKAGALAQSEAQQQALRAKAIVEADLAASRAMVEELCGAAQQMILLCEENEDPDMDTEWWVRGYNALAEALVKSKKVTP